MYWTVLDLSTTYALILIIWKTLDLVIMSARDDFIRNPCQGHLFSDHNIVFFDITSNRAKTGQPEISFRKLKNISMQVFCNDISSYLSGIDFTQFSLDACVNFYNSMLSSTLDINAPLKIK